MKSKKRKLDTFFSGQDARGLYALESEMNNTLKEGDQALRSLKKVRDKVKRLRRRHYGINCGV